MSAGSEWLKQVVFCLCFLELLYHLLPGKDWQKYLRFTGGLIFMLVLFRPVLQAFSLTGKLEQNAWKWQIQEESSQLQEAQKELGEFQNDQIRRSYCRELESQIADRVQYHGGAVKEVRVTVSGEDITDIRRIQIWLEKEPEDEQKLREELAEGYGTEAARIQMYSM